MLMTREAFKNDAIKEIANAAIALDTKYKDIQEQCIKHDLNDLDNFYLIYKLAQESLSRAIRQIDKGI